jgi:hypothetical protein
LTFLAKPSGPKAFFCFAIRAFSSFSIRSATTAEGFPRTTIRLGLTKYLSDANYMENGSRTLYTHLSMMSDQCLRDHVLSTLYCLISSRASSIWEPSVRPYKKLAIMADENASPPSDSNLLRSLGCISNLQAVYANKAIPGAQSDQ